MDSRRPQLPNGGGAAVRIRGLVFLAATAVVALGGAALLAQEERLRPFAGRVVGITDGDTLSVMKDGATVTVRLEGIDAPDRGQAFSQAAKQKLSDIAYGRVTYVYPKERDRYDRIVARVVADNRDLSEHMVLAGFAWHYTDYSSDPVLAALQRDAHAAPRGMWVDPSNRPPSEYRKAQKQRPRPTEEPKEVPVIRQSRAAPQAEAEPRRSSSRTIYHGNTSSKIFHAPWCQHYNCKNCTKIFRSREEAIRAGYRPGKVCKP